MSQAPNFLIRSAGNLLSKIIRLTNVDRSEIAIQSNFPRIPVENFARLSGLRRRTIDLIASIVSKPREETRARPAPAPGLAL